MVRGVSKSEAEKNPVCLGRQDLRRSRRRHEPRFGVRCRRERLAGIRADLAGD